jgi:hypothetical protein
LNGRSWGGVYISESKVKLTVRTFVVSLVAIVSIAAGATYAAAAAKRTITVNSQRVYRVDIAIEKAEQKVRVSSQVLAEHRAQARITPCLLKTFLPVFQAAAAKSTPNAERALYALSAEAGAEYEFASTKPVMTPVLNGVGRMLKLPLPAALRSRLKDYLPTLKALGKLNVCADARAWWAGDLTPAHEPKDTAHTTAALTALNKLGATTAIEFSGLTPSEVRYRNLEKKRADKHLNALQKQADNSIKSWIKKVITTLEHEVETAQPTTTQTTTTPTTTTPTLTQTTPTITVGPPTTAIG